MIIRPIWDQDRKIEGMESHRGYEKYCPEVSVMYDGFAGVSFEFTMVLENEARENIEKDKVKTK